MNSGGEWRLRCDSAVSKNAEAAVSQRYKTTSDIPYKRHWELILQPATCNLQDSTATN
jgi:hypothetical protein